jgi:gluconolactonase
MKHAINVCLLLVESLVCVMGDQFDIRNEADLKKCVSLEAKVQKLAGGMKFTEGPVWVDRDGGYLVFSDIPTDELKKWSEEDGLKTYRQPSRNANGNTVDKQKRLITCEHSGRRVSIEEGGELKTLVDRFDGKKFNSPNDAAVKSDGTIWFTDPDYGLGNNPKEQGGNWVYRFDPKTGETKVLVKDFDKPNGICFSPDEKKLYIADSGSPRHIRVFDVQKDGTVSNGKVLCQIDNGVPDGIRCDNKGCVWSSAGDGVHIFAPDGSLIGKILVPESPANLCFGGKNGKTLFITARSSLYAIETRVKGAK